MDGLGDRQGKVDNKEKDGFFSRVLGGVRSARQSRSGERGALFLDVAFFLLGYLFSRRHIIFGVRPLGIVVAALLPTGVWQTLAGAAVGSLSLGIEGIGAVLAYGAVLVLRLILSADSTLFAESFGLRLSVSLLGGAVSMLYGTVRMGFTDGSLLFGVFSVLLPPAITFLLSGVFFMGISVKEIVFSERGVLSLAENANRSRRQTVLFSLSALAFLFLLCLSLSEYSIFGISPAIVLSSLLVLLSARRFGTLGAVLVGFFSSLGVLGASAVSFAIMGLTAGLTIGFGIGYAVLGAGVALALWTGYTEGLVGLLSVLPEFAISAMLCAPLLKNVNKSNKSKDKSPTRTRSPEDMVSTVALSYKCSARGFSDALEDALSSLASVIRRDEGEPDGLTLSECKRAIEECAEAECRGCRSRELCLREDIFPHRKNIDRLSSLFLSGEPISSEDINTDTEFCQRSGLIAKRLCALSREKSLGRGSFGRSHAAHLEYSLVARLVSEARESDERERETDTVLTASLLECALENGLTSPAVRVVGRRKKHIILACEDEDGRKITSGELHTRLEGVLGARLGGFEYFRHGKIALAECSARPSFSCEAARARLVAGGERVSGDTAEVIETEDGRFFGIICDGMGHGEEAGRTSRLATEILRPFLGAGVSEESLVHLLNGALCRRAVECSVAVDIFSFDLVTGAGSFIKSGAAPSYIKRGGSVFRIRSHTTPLGLLETASAERIGADVREGDIIVLLSDGVSADAEDAPWLIELLGREECESLSGLADKILDTAKGTVGRGDDMSVVLIKIKPSSVSKKRASE